MARSFEDMFRARAELACEESGAAFREGGDATGRAFVRAVRDRMAAYREAEGYRRRPRRLLDLGVMNPKTRKDKRALVASLSLAPARLSGVNVCPMSTAGCRAGCVGKAGRGGLPAGMRARVTLTRWILEDPDGFAALLVVELRAAERKAARLGVPLAVRLNMFSDVDWFGLLPWLPDMFPRAVFYGYSKRPELIARAGAYRNVTATYSVSERDRGRGAIAEAVEAYGTAAVVIGKRAAFPLTVEGCPTVDGDATDLRYLDPRGSVVVLRAKGAAKAPFVRVTVDA